MARIEANRTVPLISGHRPQGAGVDAVNQYRGNLGGGVFNHNHHWFDPTGTCPAPAPCDNVGADTPTSPAPWSVTTVPATRSGWPRAPGGSPPRRACRWAACWPTCWPPGSGCSPRPSHAIAPFSSRGPSLITGGIKPDVAAPGVNVRSSLPGNSYGSLSGTSMAAPHVSGTVALIWSAAPAATLGDVPLTQAVIGATTTDVNDLTCGGVPANNNVWGQGRLNAFVAVSVARTL